MEFKIGDKIFLRHTGEQGRITSNLGGGMFNVRLDSDPDFEIPTFADDLQHLAGGKPKIAAAPILKPDVPAHRTIETQYIILKPKGLQLGFEAILNSDNIPSKYDVWLINDTKNQLALEADFFVLGRQVLACHELIKPLSALRMGHIMADDLNDAPELDILCQKVTTEGLSQGVEKTVKFRAKQFFKNLTTAPILNKPLHLFILVEIEKIEQEEAEESTENQSDIKDYTKAKVKENEEIKRTKAGNSQRYKAYDVEAFVDFPNEIDLHIQNLVNGYASMNKAEIVRIQLQHFEKYMADALRLGLHRVFIIHGVGEGKLKEAISQRLKANPHVKKFKNEFHPKYGVGATEVIFEW